MSLTKQQLLDKKIKAVEAAQGEGEQRAASIYTKLFAVQCAIGAIAKDSQNPYFKSMYFDVNKLLGELKPVLNRERLLVLQPLGEKEGRPTLETLIIDPESNEKLSWFLLLPESTDPQKMGAIITYFRRYALQSLFLLEAEDTDGNGTGLRVSPEEPFYENPSEERECPSCKKKHKGKYPRCYECYLRNV